MRNWALAAIVVGLAAASALLLLGTSNAAGQEPRLSGGQEAPGQVRAQFTPLTIEEPRRWPVGFQDSASGPRGIRPVSAETPLAPSAERPPLKLAPKSEAGRQSLSHPAANSPGRALGTVAGSLGVVLGLFFVIAWSLQRVGPKPGTRLPKEAMELLGQAPLVGRQQMQLVRVGNRLLVLAISAGSAETLAEISEPSEVEHLLALCRKGAIGSASATFRQALEEMAVDRDDRQRAKTQAGGMRGGR